MSETAHARRRFLSAILVDAGVATPDQIDEALATQRQSGRRMGEILVDMGAVTEEDLGWALARQLGLPFLDVQADALDPDLVRSFPDGMLFRLDVVPLVRAEHGLSLAVADPTDGDLLATVEHAAGCPVTPSVATRSAIRSALTQLLGPPRETHPAGARVESTHPFDVVWDRSGTTFLLFHVSRALQEKASEIHFLPGPDDLRVAYRVRGRLVEVAVEPPEVTYALLLRLASLGGPAIDDRHLHASGQVVFPHGTRDILLDVSLLNCEHGVSTTLGLRPRLAEPPSIETLGFDPVDLAAIRDSLEASSGLVLVTGTVRSGCSTTLASLLAEANRATGLRRALALETRPGPNASAVERLRVGVEQARAEWAEIVLAQNPDVVVLEDVLVGEAIEEVLGSAGAGRLILASTDWTDSFALLEWLARHPHRRSTLVARLRLVVQQRLVHLPAPTGKAGEPADARRALFEVLHVTDEVRAGLTAGDDAARLRSRAAAGGFRSLSDQIGELFESGVIGRAEAQRLSS